MNKDALLNIVEHIIGQSKIFLGTKKGGFNLGVDKFNNDLNLLLLKSIFGALRPWWRYAYDSCEDGNDFNVPELWPNANAYKGFEDHHHELLTEFCDVVADELGYYNADMREEEEYEKAS